MFPKGYSVLAGVLLFLLWKERLIIAVDEEDFRNQTDVGEPVTPSLVNSQSLGFPSHNPEDIHFYSFPSLKNSSKGDEIIIHNLTSLEKSSVRPFRRLVVFIHGFVSNSSSHFPWLILKTYMNSSLDYNYIVVDWGLLTHAPIILYPVVYADVVKRNIPTVAKRVAEFILFLNSANYTRLDLVHVIGHSLGAHVSGWAGKLIQDAAKGTNENLSESDTSIASFLKVIEAFAHRRSFIDGFTGTKKIWRISGLDPAGPLFDGIEVQRKLKNGDAQFLDVYHTAIGTRGDSKVAGHVDFYPNGGYVQPPCKLEDYANPLFLGSCSHRFVSNIYAATILRNITACPCAELDGVKGLLPKCSPPAFRDHCANETLVGERLPDSVRGQFYFEFTDLGIFEDVSEIVHSDVTRKVFE